MSDIKLILQKRTLTGKKLKELRKNDIIPSVVYGGEKEPTLTQSNYIETFKVAQVAGYHSPLDLEIDSKKQLAIIKNISVDPVTRKIINIEFQAVSANEIVEATAPITIVDFEDSKASKANLALLQVMEDVEIKAKPADLPKELTISGADLSTLEDKLTIGDLKLPKGVELADKELEVDQVIANLYDPAAEAAAREAESSETVEAADVPSDNGAKSEVA